QLPDGLWELLGRTRGRLVEGEEIQVDPGGFRLRLLRKTSDGHWLARPNVSGSATDLLRAYGQMPLPPYIRTKQAGAGGRERHQPVFARRAGAVPAPTAGLHFTPQLLARLQERGIECTFVTLHVGLGTFQPIQVEDFTQHAMHRESGELLAAAAEAIVRCRARRGRVVA